MAPETSAGFGPLTSGQAIAVAAILAAAHNTRRVARAVDGDVLSGQARSVGDLGGNFAGPGDDLRGMWLRVTLTTGFEAFWPMQELIDEFGTGEFVCTYDEPAPLDVTREQLQEWAGRPLTSHDIDRLNKHLPPQLKHLVPVILGVPEPGR
jgi:hypothetical protein